MNTLSKSQKLVYDMEKYAGGSIAVICGSMLIEGSRDQAELTAAVNELYRLNTALRTRIAETDGGTAQFAVDYAERDIDVLRFDSKDELDRYANKYAQQSFDLYGELCEISVVLMPGHYGVLVKFHHIIGDAWTIALIGTQFNTLLNGEVPPAYSYTEYLESEAEYLQSSRYAKSRTFFLEQFKKCDEVVYLSEKQTTSFASNRRTFVLKGGKAAQIYNYSKTKGISPFVLFLSSAAMYINRTKQNADKFYIGTTVLNRASVREKNTMGMFVNTVPVMIELDNEKSAAENLAAIKKAAFSIFRHQKFNYGDVLAEIRKEYGFTDRLYDVVISYQNAVITGAENRMETTWYHCGAQNETLQIHIDDRDREGVFRIHFDYQTDKFTEHEIERMYNHVINLLFDAIKNDSKPLYELELLSAGERQRLLHDFNDTAAEYPRDKCVRQLFEEQARKTPEKTALIACDRTLTYGELNEQANRIANSLIERGVKPGDIVAFVLPRRSYLIAAMFGILKAGAAYLPIDPDYPKDRIDYLLHESAAKLCIGTDNIEEFLAHPCLEIPYPKIDADDAFCALHTSGSTGVPKLSLLKHGGLSNFILANQRFWENTDTVVSATIVTFDAFTMDSVLSIAQGYRLVLASEDDIYNQEKFEKLFDYSTHNMFFSTPTKIEHYIDNSQTGEFLSRIQNLVVGGEIFNDSLAEKIERFSNCHIFNIYGPTETTICITVDEVEKGRIITIGKPIANTQIYIVDRYMQPVPIGVTGELCIAGDGVGAGYLNRSELTAEKFIDNPFGSGKLYKTGDLACWREDGNIVYVGRNDFQVKIRGLRIELGEIENALQGVQGILQAVVTVRKDESGRQLICAFYSGQETDGKILRAAIGQSLPKYMLPHSFAHLDELPLTSSGKVNRKALPEVDLSQIATAAEYVEPVGEVEKGLAALMEQVLGYSPIGRDDDFFDLGGDSLKAIELISALEKAGYHTDVKTLFECGNIRNLAVRLTPTAYQQPVFTDLPTEVPATPAQMRVYTAQAMQGGTAYNVPYAFRAASMELERLQKAVQVLVDRHEALRTHFEDKDGRIMQVVEQEVPIQVERLDTDDISAFVRPFDLSKAPLLRVGYCGNTVMIDMHHIISDGASMPIFLRELNEAYMGRTLGPTPVPYRQFAMEPLEHGDSEAYWLSVYSDELPLLELNTDFKREQKQNFSGDALYEVLDSALHQKILAASRRLGVTPYVFYIGGFYILLSKFSGNEDVVVGTPMSGRAGAYLDTLGMFVNTVALRGKPAGTKTVSEFLAEIKDSSIDAVAHQDYPYGELVKKLGANTTDHNPLFDVMFAFQSEKMTDVVFGDEKAELLPVPVTTSKYDFTFNLMPMDNGVTVMVEYCTSLYREATMRRFVAGYELILSQMLDEQKQLKGISAIFEQETNALLHDFNNTAADYPRDKCVHQLFEEQAKKTPEKTAVIACDRTLTYGELNEQANRIANGLIGQGVKPGDIVAFVLSRRSYLIAAMFGILKVGAAYLPIDPDHPQDRINYMVWDSGAAFFITENNITTLLAHNNASEPNVAITLDYPCYCIYTSGSTGRPKGTVLKHRGMVNYSRNTHNNHVVHEVVKSGYQSVVSVTTVGFDIFATESVLPLVNGLTVILADEKQAMIQAELNSLLARKKADVLQTTPTKMRSLMGDAAECTYLNSLKAVILGGEAVDSSLIYTMKQLTSARIFNIYGPTETTVWSTNTEIFSDTDITIGKPIANTQIYIVDRYMQPVPIGVTGELCIAGDGVGVGYLNRSELTAEKFIDNSFGNGKLYKTGDLAYWREDGSIVYVGRNDFQVKIRGLRIELGEIENALQGVEGILQAVVTVRKTEDGRQLICAFYTGQETDGKILRAAIGQSLPKYMLPHSFTHLAELPLTSSGKVNRKALPEVDLSQIATVSEYVEPVGEVEKQLAALMEQVLGCSPIGREDDFFDLGGDSLKAIELISALEKAGYHTDVKTLFECGNIRNLAVRLMPTVYQQPVFTDLPNEVPATPAQMRVYTAQAMQGGTAYNVPYAFRTSTVEREKLQKAVQVLVDRHEALRTHFEDKDGRITQVVEQEVSIQVEQLDADDISAFVRPFDLSKAPLLRVGYCGNTAMVDMHHIISDGASMPIFLREMNELYMGRALGPAPVSYRQFSMERQDYGDSEAYWLSVYSDELPMLELNTDFKRGQKQNFSGSALYESLNSALHQKILAASRRMGVTPYVFYIGGFYILLSKFSGNEDIVVGTPMSGRAGAYLDTLGMFVNTVALRGKPAGTKIVSEFLAEVKDSSIEAVAHQDYPYGELVKKLGVNSTDRNPLFDVMFAFQSEKLMDVVFGDEKAELLPVPVATSKYDFTFNLMPMDNGVTVMVEYCTSLYRETTMRRFAAGYELVLSQMLDERKQIKDISAVTEQEIATLLHDFNDTAADYPRDKCVHQLFEEQAEKTPEKTAVIACDRTLTYGELNEQANRIANGLIERGVKPGDIVAFVLPRRSYLIAAMFGILKAGAAYLPIDPDYPQDRINYMVEDSGAAFFITEDNIIALLEHGNNCDPNVEITANALCYCIYTSGSTGRPKGTVITHRNVVNYTHNNSDNVVHKIIKSSYRTIVSVTTVGFDIFVTESILPLLNGLEIILADEKQATIQSELNSLLAREKADVLQTTPTKMRSLIGDADECAYLNSLKAIILGGETLDSSLIYTLKRLTSARIFNIYGPTETTVWSTNTEIFSDTDITIGKPIANTQIYIVDRYMQLVPIGVTGELCIAGDGVGAGYLNRPELTAEKFIDNPFGNGKLYKTGDLAYWREDGSIVYAGRNDFQVKIRGLRIELVEIENALQGVQGILQSVVTVRRAEDGRQIICAFYTGQETDGKILRAAIGQSLPKYMLPHSFTQLDEMPLTSSGKVNRKALPEVDLSQIATAAEYIEPVGEMEKQLAVLMEQVLGYSPIGREDDFFDLGGDSLKAIEFVSKAHSEGIYFALQSIFDHPTVRQLTEYIQADDKQTVFYSDADFTEINKILEKNKLEYITTPQKIRVGNILLAGATGYLGIHILADFIEHENGVAFCLVRGKNQADSEKRLTDLLNFYFGGRYSVCERIKVLCADLQKEHLGLTEQEYEVLIPKISTVINAAASVKHYGSYQYFYETNVETVKRLIEFCRIANAKLIHTSTISVSGNSFAEEFSGYISETEKHFFESSLYIGQPLDNVYARSKFEAEKVILEAMGKGLKANILRMGNLSNRLSDGIFQKNHETNAALKRVKAVLELGMIPDYLMDIYAEFTPIDEAARAVMLITQHFSAEQTVFHINSTKVVYLNKLQGYFTDLGYPIDAVDGAIFTDALRKTMEQSGMKHIFETFIGDLDVNDRLNYDSNIRIENDFTSQYLRRLGFKWSDIGIEYFRKYVRYFKKIGYLGDTADK